MSSDAPRPAYDLEERTAKFGEAIIGFCKRIKVTTITMPRIGQVVKSATSVGANYCEADDAVLKKEFRLKIATCKKEARETKHWLRMLAAADETIKEEARTHWQEAKELHLIFAAIWRRGKQALGHSCFDILSSFVLRHSPFQSE
jgi:four helix bundle protein